MYMGAKCWDRFSRWCCCVVRVILDAYRYVACSIFRNFRSSSPFGCKKRIGVQQRGAPLRKLAQKQLR